MKQTTVALSIKLGLLALSCAAFVGCGGMEDGSDVTRVATKGSALYTDCGVCPGVLQTLSNACLNDPDFGDYLRCMDAVEQEYQRCIRECVMPQDPQTSAVRRPIGTPPRTPIGAPITTRPGPATSPPVSSTP